MSSHTILCFGDSNTHGTRAHRKMGDRRRHDRHDRWPSVMAAALGSDYEVIAEGQPGRTAAYDDPINGETKNGLRLLPALLETHRPIDLVIVMLGTNDVKLRFPGSASDIAAAMDRVLMAIQSSEAGPDGESPRILLVAPSPVQEVGFMAEMFAGGAEKSRALAGHYANLAQRRKCSFLDLAPVAKVDPVDGVHLSADAHAAIGAAMAKAVRPILSATSPGGVD